MDKTVDLSSIVSVTKSEFSVKKFKEIAKSCGKDLESFMHEAKFTDKNGISYEVMNKHNIEGVLKVAAESYSKHHPLMKTFKIPTKDAEEYFRDEFYDEEFSELNVVAVKDGKVIGFLINDDEIDVFEEEEPNPNDKPYANKDLDDYVVCIEEFAEAMETGYDMEEAKDEGEHCFITDIGVDPAYHRQGIASNMFKISIALAIHCGYKKLMTSTVHHAFGDILEDMDFTKLCKGQKVATFELEGGDMPFDDVEDDFVATFHGIELK